MIVKVCGMTDQANLDALVQLDPTWFGMIYYAKSKRFLQQALISEKVKRIGVFVNESFEHVLQTARDQKLDGVQLHGEETPTMTAKLRERGLKVIKAISIGNSADLIKCKSYEGAVDFLLFDTKGKDRGGNGISFDWEILSTYYGTTPFLLAGGIGPNSLPALRRFSHPLWQGIDINSRFEIAPGIKDISSIKTFLHELRSR